MESIIKIEVTRNVIRCEPHSSAAVVHAVDVLARARVDPCHLGCRSTEVSVIYAVRLSAEIHTSRIPRIRDHTCDLARAELRAVIELCDSVGIDLEDRTVLRIAVDSAVVIGDHIKDTLAVDPLVVDHMDLHDVIDIHKTRGRTYEDIAVRILGETPDRRRRESLILRKMSRIIAVDHDYAVIVRRDPDASLRILIKTSSARKAVRRRQSLEYRSVVSYDSAVAADPYISVVRGKYAVGFGCGKSVRRIIDLGSVADSRDLTRDGIAASDQSLAVTCRIDVNKRQRGDHQRHEYEGYTSFNT